MHHQRARKADSLAHAAGELARVGGLEAVEADQVDRLQRARAHLRLRHAERLEPELHVLEHREPGKEREALEHHGDARRRACAPADRGSSPRPPEGGSRPAIERSSVDLPEPERPSSPTISPGRSVRLTFSSTTSSSPSGLRKDLLTPCTSSSGARFSGAVAFTAVSFGRPLSSCGTCARRARTAAARRRRFSVTTNRLSTTVPSTMRRKSAASVAACDVGAEPVRRHASACPR